MKTEANCSGGSLGFCTLLNLNAKQNRANSVTICGTNFCTFEARYILYRNPSFLLTFSLYSLTWKTEKMINIISTARFFTLNKKVFLEPYMKIISWIFEDYIRAINWRFFFIFHTFVSVVFSWSESCVWYIFWK